MGYIFPEVKHVILDEVQSFRKEDGDWLDEARKIVRQHSNDSEHDAGSDSDSVSIPDLDSDAESNYKLGPNLDQNVSSDSSSDSDSDASPSPDSYHIRGPDSGPGFLWLFIDSNQINHTFPTGIPQKKDQIPSFRLTKVIRNSKNIFNYAKKFLLQEAASQIEMGHDFEGEGKKFRRYPRGQGIATLREELELLCEEGYSKGDIAVLFGREEDIPKGNLSEGSLSKQLGLKRIVGAEENDSEHVVVSTFRMYSGLERPVVILVNIKAYLSVAFGSKRRASLYCATTRGMVKLIMLEEKTGEEKEKRGYKRKHMG